MESCTKRISAYLSSKKPFCWRDIVLSSSPCATCGISIYLILFISEAVIILAEIVVGDAEDTSIVIIF